MRRTLTTITALLLVGAIVFSWLQSQRKASYPYPSVAAEVARIASSSGAHIIDERTVSASVRGSRVGFGDSLYRKISGRPLLDDLEEYTLRDGPDIIRVTVHHSLGMVELVEIRPSSKSSKPAAALESGLTASFPKLDCDLGGP
jgi:hypothetical protein